MIRNHWKVLKNKYFSWFLVIPKNDEKNDAKEDLKNHVFLIQNGDMGFPDSTYPLIFDVLVDQIIEKVEPWSAKGSPRGLTPFAYAKFSGGRGPQDQLKVGPYEHWTISFCLVADLFSLAVDGDRGGTILGPF